MNRRLRAIIWCAVSTKAQAADDKDSLATQEREARAICDREGWHVIEVLSVPGHTRRVLNFDRLAEQARRKGISAFDRLNELWANHGFDILVCRDDDRFARSQSIHAYIIEMTIDMDARIYTVLSGWIDQQNYRGRIALGGYKVAGEIDNNVHKQRNGRNNMSQRGLPTTKVPFPYLIVRDPRTAKRLAAVVDESYRPLLNTLAQLILDGVGWGRIEFELARRGYFRPDGGVYAANYFQHRLTSPFWWGNTASAGYNRHPGLWAFDPAEPAPAEITVHYDNHPPVYSGQLADDLKAEIRRRVSAGQGNGRFSPGDPYRYSKLLICDECGCVMSGHWSKAEHAEYACASRFKSSPQYPECHQRGHVHEALVQQYMENVVRGIAKRVKFPWLDFNAAEQVESKLTRLERDITALESKMEALIENQATAPANARHLYDKRIALASEQLADKERERGMVLSTEARATHTIEAQRAVCEDIRANGPEWFWNHDDRWLNQQLHKILGDNRLYLRDKEVKGIALIPPSRAKFARFKSL